MSTHWLSKARFYLIKVFWVGLIGLGITLVAWVAKRLFFLVIVFMYLFSHDPEGSALLRVQECLDMLYSHPTPTEDELRISCGLGSYDCLELLQETVVDYPQPYELEVVYRTWDRFCVMPNGEVIDYYEGGGPVGNAGDTVVVEATFANQQTVTIHIYEGAVQTCYLDVHVCPHW